jgi:hypothetical protein
MKGLPEKREERKMNKILLIADVRGWIFERHCREIKRRLVEYEVDIAYCRGSNIRDLSPKYDLIYALDPMPMPYPCPEKTILGLRSDWFHKKHPQGALGMYNDGWPGCGVSLKENCCMLHLLNKPQYEEFSKVVDDKPLFIAQHGVDIDCFNPDGYEKPRNKILTVGTSGRARSNNEKGFDLVQQACSIAGVDHHVTRYKNRVSKDQMPSFYNNIDVYVCMSKMEGLNNPTLEAGAMGVPVISTRSGAAEQVITNGENGLLIDRNVEALVAALEKVKDVDIRVEMGRRLRDEITTKWSWAVKIEEYRHMFNMFFDMKGEK